MRAWLQLLCLFCLVLVGHAANYSSARMWNEALLSAVRLGPARPPVVARNLYTLSVVLFDSVAMFHNAFRPVMFNPKGPLPSYQDRRLVQEQVLNYAAHRVLSERYAGSPASLAIFDALLQNRTNSSEALRPFAELGVQLANATLLRFLNDGCLEGLDYQSPWPAKNPPLNLSDPALNLPFPDLWQPIGTQSFLCPQWADANSTFGLRPSDKNALGVYFNVAPAPKFAVNPQDFITNATYLAVLSSWMDPFVEPGSGELDIGPRARGRNPLGTNNGNGYKINRATGRPYAAVYAKLGDYSRALTEYWSDGPQSETPPGHWNVIANQVSDDIATKTLNNRPANNLEWDVALYLTLNGALHDAAIAAWGYKRTFDSARPVTAIRYLGKNGQSSNSTARLYSPRGIALVPGSVEMVSPSENATRVQILLKTRTPDGVRWIRPSLWNAYLSTPSFPGYVSGHSTFSRAAAEALAAFTQSEFFPGGIKRAIVPKNSLKVTSGPSEDVELTWASYFDAADEAGISRLFGGIHVPADDIGGRILGNKIGRRAWVTALTHFTRSPGP